MKAIDLERLLVDRLGLTLIKRQNNSLNVGRDVFTLLSEALSTLCVQFEDEDGENGYFYNTPETTPSRAVAHAFGQHIVANSHNADELSVIRVFVGRFDGYNLVDVDHPRSVKDHLNEI